MAYRLEIFINNDTVYNPVLFFNELENAYDFAEVVIENGYEVKIRIVEVSDEE